MAILSNTGIRAGASGAGGDAYQIEKSLRFNDDGTAYLNRTPSSSTTNQKQFTLSFWMKRGQIEQGAAIFHCGANTSTTGYISIYLDSTDDLHFLGHGGLYLITSALYRDPSAWYHFVIAVDTTQTTDLNKLKLYVNGVQDTNWSLASWCSDDKEYLVNTNTNHEIGVARGGTGTLYYYFDGLMAEWYCIDGQTLTASDFGETNATTGQWIPKEYTGSYGTNGFHLKFDNASDLGEDSSGEDNDWTANNLAGVTVPTIPNISADTFSGDVTHYNNGGALNDAATLMFNGGDTTTDYCYCGTNNAANHITWTPDTSIPDTAHNDYIWICGGNGNGDGLDNMNVYINGSGSPSTKTAEIDQSGGSHHWNNWYKYTVSGTFTSFKVEGVYTIVRGVSFKETPAVSGTHMVDGADHITPGVDMVDVDVSTDTPTPFDDEGNGTGNYATLNPLNPGASTLSNGNLDASGTGDLPTIIPGSGQWYYEIDGTGYDWDGTVADFTDAAGSYNFGQRPFEGTVTTGYKALNTFNLDDPLIDDPSKHFDVGLDAGADILSTAIGLTDGADFVWIKDRDNSDDHILFNRITDSGMDGTPHMRSNEKDTEATCGTYSAPSGNSVAWVWNAGSANVTNDASSTGIGTIDSTYRANPSAGFSIVSYTGELSANGVSKIAHGLNAIPAMVITKSTSYGSRWSVQHKGLTAGYILELEDDAAQDNFNTYGSMRLDNSNTFDANYTIGGSVSGRSYIAYCWSEVDGYSKFGSYTGNDVDDGVFVHCGFKPAFVMIKNRDNSTAEWIIVDNARSTDNVVTHILNPDDDTGDSNTDLVDFLSNGFKLRSGTSRANESGNTMIYAAFAETPFKYSNAR